MRYSYQLLQQVQALRAQGKTYGEIRAIIKQQIPKSTLSEWCKNVQLPNNYLLRIEKLNLLNLNKGRLIALEINKIKREELSKSVESSNLPISKLIENPQIAKIALAMLCLGEASKTKGMFNLGSSDPRIIILFLEMLKKCFLFDIEKVRCTVQCRADQDTKALEYYWMNVTKIPKRLFYKARIDPRTKGKPTMKNDYRGVLRIDYLDTKVKLELETLAQLIYNQVV